MVKFPCPLCSAEELEILEINGEIMKMKLLCNKCGWVFTGFFGFVTALKPVTTLDMDGVESNV